MNIDNGLIPYHYQECDITINGLPKDETNIRFDNITVANIPVTMFVGITPAANFSGNAYYSSTSFDCTTVSEFDITLNCHSVNGYSLLL